MAEAQSPKDDIDGVANGTIAETGGEKRVFYDGYWIRHYEPPEETLTAKQDLITGLTRRTFHHTESGINTPGRKLDLARQCYEQAENEQEKRVSGAMLAGALFNRATDIFKTVVDLEAKGVHISTENELMKECSECLEEAMELGKLVRHISGVEGIDELWGEPLKAFIMPLSQFYVTRYVKISMTMRDIDRIVAVLRGCCFQLPEYEPLWPLLDRYSIHAKSNCETSKRDPRWYAIWPKFVTRSEQIDQLIDQLKDQAECAHQQRIVTGCRLLKDGKDLIYHISGARVPMPDTTKRFIQKCNQFNPKFDSSKGSGNEK